ncbi:MAG: hypothetical protein NTW65_04225 [Deltaproteobacteria bacterium]|nr:hypothetical protein [Deltaproteobacteria bacterium]
MKSEYSGSIIRNGRILPYRISPLIISICIAFITLAVFAFALTADFRFWDDDWCIFKNPRLGILNLQNLWLIFTDKTFSSSFYTPLTGLRWCITYTFWGLNPVAYHLGNLLFHAANAVLLFFFVRKLVIISLENKRNSEITQLRVDVASAIAVLLWSLHPLRVEPVASAAAGAHVQAIFFMLLSLLGYFRYNEDKKKYFHWLIISAACYGASVLSQPVTLALPAVLVVLDVYPLKRIVMVNGWWKSQEVRSAILDKIPFIVISLAVIVANVTLVTGGNDRPLHEYVPLAQFGLLDRIMQAFYIWSYYVWRPWYPVNLSPVYSMLLSFDPLSLPFVCSAIGIIGGTIIILLYKNKYPYILAAWICHLIILLPVLGLNVNPHYTSDRYALSVSMIWSVLLAGWIVTVRKSFLFFLFPGLISILIIFGIMSNKQVRIWHNTETLCRYMLEKTKDEPKFTKQRALTYEKLATYYMKNGRAEESIYPLTEDIRLNPQSAYAHAALGIILFQQDRKKEAFTHLYKSIKIDSSYIDSYSKFAEWLRQKNRNEEALEVCERILEIDPNHAETRAIKVAILGSLLQKQTKKIKIKPDFPEVRLNP